MPRFDPFTGVRYSPAAGPLDALVAPPYDVVSPEQRAHLLARSEGNAIRLELPADEDGHDRYQVAASLWRQWRREGLLSADEQPCFYLYRMGFHDEEGRPRQTTGVLGALALSAPGQDVLPHEHTMAKDKTDRLELLRAVQVNLSPIWVLSTAAGLTGLLEPSGPPTARATDEDGVHHRLWRVSQAGVVGAIAEAVGSHPVVIADGHHRFETALAYREERRRANGGAGGPYDAVMAYAVELSDEELAVRPIHRLISGLAPGFDLVEALSAHFEVVSGVAADGTLPARMAAEGALALATPEGAWLLRPRPETAAAAAHEVDASLLDVALRSLPSHQVAFQHGLAEALGALRYGRAQAVVLLRPATVSQIAAVAGGGERMPPKTTFFAPKLRTGLVFREVPG